MLSLAVDFFFIHEIQSGEPVAVLSYMTSIFTRAGARIRTTELENERGNTSYALFKCSASLSLLLLRASSSMVSMPLSLRAFCMVC